MHTWVKTPRLGYEREGPGSTPLTFTSICPSLKVPIKLSILKVLLPPSGYQVVDRALGTWIFGGHPSIDVSGTEKLVDG